MRLWSLLSTVVLSACSTFGIRSGYESPPYRTLDTLGDVEVRAYGPRLVAETTVTERDDAAARDAAFRLLAGYIFGDNRARADVAMTTPVEVARQGVPIAMTTPVETAAPGPGATTMRFFLPSALTTATAPVPTDARVRIRTIPGDTVAVLRFSGDGADVAARTEQLLQVLAGSGWAAAGPAVTLFYDPPWTLPFLRRNEVAVPVRVPVRG